MDVLHAKEINGVYKIFNAYQEEELATLTRQRIKQISDYSSTGNTFVFQK